ncbi:hypothetical protein MD484_g3280, partial [Candolleomyces efflorescens]
MSSKSDVRTAEFAKLLQFFDHLASRGGGKKNLNPSPGFLPPLQEALEASSNDTTPAPSGSNETPTFIPSDITPVVANLTNTHHRTSKLKSYASLGIGKTKRNHRQSASGSDQTQGSTASSSNSRSASSSSSTGLRGASTSSTMTSSSLQSEGGKISLAKFPLANNKQRPFTFRLMLHKLYATRDDWLQKVQEALEQSKKEYKSLAEQESELEEGACRKGRDGDGVEDEDTKFRRRCKSSVAASTSLSSSPGPTLTATGPNTGNPGMRAVKKRCVGRRKSFDGPLSLASTADTKLGLSAWVYEAAIAQLDSDTESNYHRGIGSQRRRRSVSASAPSDQIDRVVGNRTTGGTKQEDVSATIARKAASSWRHIGPSADEDEKNLVLKSEPTAAPLN